MEEERVKTLPQHTCTWLKGNFTLYKDQDFWNPLEFLQGGIFAQQSFKALPDDVFVCSSPKTGMTWLKALAFAIVTRQKYDESTTPLLTTMPHECIPFLEDDLQQIEQNHNKDSRFPLVATHLPYHALPESVAASNCKIVYIYRNIKDVFVSYYHFMREVAKLPMEDASFEEAFDEFCEGKSWYGPYWDHILGYWKASLERPEIILFLKYEEMKTDPTSNVKRLAEFIGYPFTVEEEKAGVIESIIKLCSFENLSNLEVNKSGKHRAEDEKLAVENRVYFRKAKDGDWENYFTEEMNEKIDKQIDEKLSSTGLVLK